MYSIKLTLEPNYFTLKYDQGVKNEDITPGIKKIIVNKNSNLFGSNDKNYNIYQIDAQVTNDIYSNLMNHQYIIHLIIYENFFENGLNKTKKVVETYLYPREVYFLGSDKTTRLSNIRIFAVNIIVAQMLIDNGIVSTSTQQMLNAFADPTTLSWTTQQPLSGRFFDEFIQKTMQDFYGSSCYAKYIGNEFAINNSVTEYFNIPTRLNSIETIKYILLNLWPYFGVPQFHIDDFYADPQIFIKFDEIITSRVEVDSSKTFNDSGGITLKRNVEADIFSTTFPAANFELIDDFDLLELKKFSKSDIINSTVNGIKNIKTTFSSHYLYDNNNIKYESSAKNPFVTIIQSDLSKYDLEKFIRLADEVTSLTLNYKIQIGPVKITDIDIGQIFNLVLNQDTGELHYFYIYGVKFELYRSTETLKGEELFDLNVNNYNIKTTIKAIEITNCPKSFDITL